MITDFNPLGRFFFVKSDGPISKKNTFFLKTFSLCAWIGAACRQGLFFGVVFLLFLSSAWAHPHVFVTMQSDIVLTSDGALTAVNVEWVFDKDYSSMALEGLDTNQDGVYSSDEIRPIVTENIKALQDYHYFVFGQINGTPVEWEPVTEYGQILMPDGRLKMYFQVRVKTPLSVTEHPFVYRIYDPSFYIAMDYPPGTQIGITGSQNCKAVLSSPIDPQKSDPVKDMLATKGKDWQPQDGDDFGVLFSQSVSLTCAKKAP